MSKYDGLARHLAERATDPMVEMTFTEIDSLVGGLPPSARRHAAWWANSRGDTHTQAWVSQDRIASCQIALERVRFIRSSEKRSRDKLPIKEQRPPISSAMAVRTATNPTRLRVGLVGCVQSKRDGVWPASQLYTSTLFTGRREFVERSCQIWYVLSAKYGLVHPDQPIDTYDVALANLSKRERSEWAQRVMIDLERELGDLSKFTFEIHAGSAYRDHGLVTGLRDRGANVEVPAEHLSRGEQLAFYGGRGDRAQVTATGEVLDLPYAVTAKEPAAPATAGISPASWKNRVARVLERTARRLRDRSRDAITTELPASSPSPTPQEAVGLNPRGVATALLEWDRARREGQSLHLAADPVADAFLANDPFAFLVAVLCNQGVIADRAWAAPLELRRRLGHWDIERIAGEPDAVRSAFKIKPALHRTVERMPLWICGAAKRVLNEYNGDTANLWSGNPTAEEVQRRLVQFDGIGQKKAAMTVEILERHFGVPLDRLDGSDIAFDVHVRRVFLRSGIATRDDSAHMVAAARSLHPDRPGTLDSPAWFIGREWCRPTEPRCTSCPINHACPKLVERGSNIRGM